MKSKHLLLLLASLALLAPVLRAADKPNILLIIADDMALSDIGC